jgi:hypothetical protein
MDKPGCRWMISIISVLFAVGLMFGSQCSSLMRANQGVGADTSPAIATIGTFKVTEKMLDAEEPKALDNAMSMKNSPEGPKPFDVASAYATSLNNLVDQGLMLMLAKQKNASLDDKSVLKALTDQLVEGAPMQIRMQLMQANKLPPNATDAQVDEAFKKMSGQTIEEREKLVIDGLQKQLDDPAEHDGVVTQAVDAILTSTYEKGITVTDDDLKKLNDTLVAKRIFIQGSKHKGKDVKQLAQEVLDQINSKKLTFEQAMDKYTDDTPAKGKPPHENESMLDMRTLHVNHDYQPILNLKPGEISAVLPMEPSDAAIYRYDHLNATPVPKDFDKTKEESRKSYMQQLAITQRTDDMKALRQTAPTKWLEAGFGILYDWYQATTADLTYATKLPAEQQKINAPILSKALDTMKTDPKGASIAAVAAMDAIWTTASEAEKAKLIDERVKVLTAFLQESQSSTYQGNMELVDLLIKNKDGKDALENLSEATAVNAQDFTNQGQQRFGDISAKLDQLKSLKLASDDDTKSIQVSLDNWRKDKLQNDQDMARQKAEDAADRKKAEEEDKKQRAKAAAPMLRGPQGTTPIPGAHITLPPGASTPQPGVPLKPPVTPPPAPVTTKPPAPVHK